MNIQAIDSFHKTRTGFLIFGVAELLLSVAITNHMLASGNWWEYVVAFVLSIGFVRNMVRVVLNK